MGSSASKNAAQQNRAQPNATAPKGDKVQFHDNAHPAQQPAATDKRPGPTAVQPAADRDRVNTTDQARPAYKDDLRQARRDRSAYRAPPLPPSAVVRPPTTVGPRSKTMDDRSKMMDRLYQIADDTRDRPPGPVYNSASYEASLEYYNQRCVANTEDELQSWYDMEVDQLVRKTSDEMVQAQFSGQDVEATRSGQEYEYHLELTALTHVFLRENAEYERQRMKIAMEQQEDLYFLEDLKSRVESGTMRPDVLSSMDGYAQRCKGRNVYPGAGHRQTYPYHSERANRRPHAGSQISDEANRVLEEYERNRQRAAEVRRQDRERISRELENRRK